MTAALVAMTGFVDTVARLGARLARLIEDPLAAAADHASLGVEARVVAVGSNTEVGALAADLHAGSSTELVRGGKGCR